MRKTFLSEISKLKDKIYVDKKTIEQFLKRLKSGRLLQKQNPADHFCSFFVPLDIKSKSVFLKNINLKFLLLVGQFEIFWLVKIRLRLVIIGILPQMRHPGTF